MACRRRTEEMGGEGAQCIHGKVARAKRGVCGCAVRASGGREGTCVRGEARKGGVGLTRRALARWNWPDS